MISTVQRPRFSSRAVAHQAGVRGVSSECRFGEAESGQFYRSRENPVKRRSIEPGPTAGAGHLSVSTK